ncbi:MAG TPA: hypothetical protein VMU34_07000 [Mycobacterium sp.]|nr:hypothetical protein [Mycobacterium sp.]
MSGRTVIINARRYWCVVLVVAVGALLAACQIDPPDRRPQAEAFTQQLRAMPGVVAAASTAADREAQGLVYVEFDVDVADKISSDQLANVISRYLDHLGTVDYRGYRTEFDARNGPNFFAIDNNDRAITNGDQIIAQARDWVGVRTRLPGATVALHATVSHGTDPRANRDGGHPSGGTISLPDNADYTAAAAAVATLSQTFPELGGGDWTISAGKDHPADIKTARRFPNAAELGVWTTLNADQSIPHIDALTINGRTTGPVWLSEQVATHDVGVALQLAENHLPIAATLPAPVLYTSGDQIQGHIDYYGHITAPVAITISGCSIRTYRPGTDEQALIQRYERCPR